MDAQVDLSLRWAHISFCWFCRAAAHYKIQLMDRGPQLTLNTENPWLNIIITHSKFISSPFTCLFSTIIQILRPYMEIIFLEINACDTCHSVDKLVRFLNLHVTVSGSLLFYTINC